MNTGHLLAGLLAIALVSGCAQQKTASSNKDRVYYHDRRTTVGSNIPRSYSDSSSANTSQGGASDLEKQQLQQFSNQNSAAAAGSAH